MADVLHVACASEGRYVPHTAAMLHSVAGHRGSLETRVHYMHGGDLSARQKSLLEQMLGQVGASIEFIVVNDERVRGLPTKGFTRKATWYRIFLPELLPDVDRVLYLDADLIVTSSLETLWRMDLNGVYLGAVTNVFEPLYAHRPRELGLAGPEVYFNAGVLLMNLALMRADDCTRELLDFGVANAADLLWRDQDALNVVLGSRRLALHPRWNCMNATLLFDWAAEVYGAEAVEAARSDQAIRHFEGPDQNKPWHYLSDPEARAVYMRHRRATLWPRLRASGRTPLNVARRAKRALTR